MPDEVLGVAATAGVEPRALSKSLTKSMYSLAMDFAESPEIVTSNFEPLKVTCLFVMSRFNPSSAWFWFGGLEGGPVPFFFLAG